MDRPTPRLTSVMGVARALLATLDAREAVEVMALEFGWDATFQALALLRGADAEAAFGHAWERLLTEPLARTLQDLGSTHVWLGDA